MAPNDILGEALKQAQAQALAQNPYSQGGAMFGQFKNPYASKNPWENIAAGAIQQGISGLASGFGQGQVAKDMGILSQVVPDLYQNPGQAVNPGVDPSVFNNLQVVGQARQQGALDNINQIAAIAEARERAKGQSPAGQLKLSEAQLGIIKQVQELVDQNAMPQGSVERAIATFTGQPMPVSTPVAQSQAEGSVGKPVMGAPVLPQAATEQVAPSKTMDALIKKYSGPGVPRGEAIKLASEEAKGDISVAVDNEKKQQDTLIKEREKLGAILKESNEKTGRLNDSLAKYEAAQADMPNFFGATGGLEESYTNLMAVFGTGARGERANAQLNAKKAVETIGAEFMAQLRKDLMPGALTEKELEFLQKTVQSAYNTPGQNKIILENLKSMRDAQNTYNSFLASGARKGLTQREIESNWSQMRDQLGGSFLITEEGSPIAVANPLLAEIRAVIMEGGS